MQNSARCVFPVESMRRFRNARSTCHGNGVSPPSNVLNAISNSWIESFLASSIRGAWEVGPTNRPEKRKLSEGW
jgi:hypothetical protein